MKPKLSNYPRLHSAMRADPLLNREFNDYVSQIQSPTAAEAREKELTDSLEAERVLRSEIQSKSTKLEEVTRKSLRFIKLLGEVIEPQVQLRPYEQDVSMKTHYDIRFNASQIRMALRLYWDAMSDFMERTLEGKGPVDPVEDPEENR